VTSQLRSTRLSGRLITVAGMTSGRGLLRCLTAVAATALAACSSAAPAASPAADYEKIVTQVYGTPLQRRAADARTWWVSRLAAVKCMRRAGHDYGIVGYNASLDREYVSPGDLLAFAPIRQDLDVADELIHTSATRDVLDAQARSVTLDNGTTDLGRVQAARRCETEVTAAATSRVLDGQDLLAGELVDVLRAEQTASAPTAAVDYRACMAAAGIPATGLADLRSRVEREFPATLTTDPARSPGWADAVAFENRAAIADGHGRLPVVEAVRAAAAPRLLTFAGRRAAELDRVAAGWAFLAVDARNAEHAAMPED
jgi:hypothetical protein